MKILSGGFGGSWTRFNNNRDYEDVSKTVISIKVCNNYFYSIFSCKLRRWIN